MFFYYSTDCVIFRHYESNEVWNELKLIELVPSQLFSPVAWFSSKKQNSNPPNLLEFLSPFSSYLKGWDINLMVPASKKTELIINQLKQENSPFEIYKEKIVFEKDLIRREKNTIKIPKEIKLIDLKTDSLDFFNQVFVEAIEGDEELIADNLPPSIYIAEILNMQSKADLTKNYKLIKINDSPAGVIILFTTKKRGIKEGTILYMALKKEFRGLGYGRLIHSYALQELRKRKCVTYYGSCVSTKTSMLSIFKKNGCTKAEEQLYFRPAQKNFNFNFHPN